MNPATHEDLGLSPEEFAILRELLESERAKLTVEVQHTDHRAFREELRRRLRLIEGMVERFGTGLSGGAASAGSGR